MFENEYKNEIINGIHCSRYVASWVRAGGKLYGSRRRDDEFIRWLKSLTINQRSLTEDEIKFIENFASSGKMELESLAEKFLKAKEGA